MMSKTSSLTDLVSIRTLEKIQDNFSEATGISGVIRDVEGKQITRMSNPSRLWQEVTKHPEVEEEANILLRQALDKCAKTGQIQIYKRYMDTRAFAVPIYLEGKNVAFFIGGLTRLGNPDMEVCSQEARRLNVDLDTYLELYLSLPLVTEEKLTACANLFKIIASTISGLAREGTQAKARMSEMAELNSLLEKEIKKTEQELFEREERFRLLFHTINDGVYMTDQNGIVKDINATGAHLLGYEPEELIGTNLRDIYVDPRRRDDFVRRIYQEGHVEHFHPHVRLKNGQTKYFETNSTVMKDKTGKIIGIQGIFRDLDPRMHGQIKKLEENAHKTAVQGNQDDKKPLKPA